MTIIAGFLAPVARADFDTFTAFARKVAPVFHELGASAAVDALADDVPHGEVTDFYRAVAASGEESVAFGWMTYPDAATKAAAEKAMMEDPRMDGSDAPFDGQRMVFGSFEPVVDEGPGGPFGFVDGFVAAVPTANREAFVRHCREAAPVFLKHGATRHVECWGVDVPDGKVTDFRRAVQARPDETVCFSWIEWPDKATHDAGQEKAFAEMETLMEENPMPFDGKRMIYGAFDVVSGGGRS